MNRYGLNWTKEEVRYLKDNWPKDGSRKVSEKLKRTFLSVNSKAKKLGLRKIFFGDSHDSQAFNLRKRYGMTIEDFDRLFEQQKGVCAICKRPETKANQYGIVRLCVDHNHKTGKVRGLLCIRCNSMLGYANDNTDTLLNAIVYLKPSPPQK